MAANGSSVFQHALQLWKQADLPNLQEGLDQAILEVKHHEEEALESRKTLATETKAFKKLDTDARLLQINKLIKMYQAEVDSLTSRFKFTEQKLFEVYGRLTEAPDPQPLLQSSLDALQGSDNMRQLQKENAALKDKLTKYADYENLKARLREVEQNSAKTFARRLVAKEQEVNSTWEEKERNWEKKEDELNKQVKTLKETNKVLNDKLSKKNGLDSEDQADGDAESKSSNSHVGAAEFRLLADELESSQVRILDLEKRNEELSGALAKASSAAERDSELHNKDLQINHLESENALLTASLERERSSLAETRKSLGQQIQTISQELTSYKGELTTVRRKLVTYSDYEQIKQELTALRKIEFGVDDDKPDEDGDLGSALTAANKKLQSSLAGLRSRNQDLEQNNNLLVAQVKNLKEQLQELEALNAKLENDLGKVEDVARFNDNMSMISGATRHITNRQGYGGKLSPTSSIIGIPEEAETVGLTSNTSILPIVTQQRDRIRNKNMELERQLKQSSLDRGKLLAEVASLRKDNQKLYERIKYISSCNSGLGESTREVSTGVDIESQYQTGYEESLHPLVQFKKSEQERYTKGRMSQPEKLFFTFANVILANKTSRLVFLAYCIALHVLVVITAAYSVSATRAVGM
ncbi:AEL136Cp [Eremothecium gossypii ATCC 10895]|uniref:Protein CASP n=1 Tax=Eremothecium gossypii (strain ATCC 10895 / CBS 109.51 / FGSC 9923 / NRRL Y-1056) TaxID=284811 RepID=Q757Z6_EREGS|nr:AEL136Cp [Eremothecium gossypii ATCC 10895]AAS52549.1 AEL136Cp [Eremothecium gossypii ATCC 10895]AEY96849.1 FAEL136Cp [Eremothecium gossypii FDAG1]